MMFKLRLYQDHIETVIDLRGESVLLRGFWRVLALEEFTDVQCVIVDHPMPSLAGYQTIGKPFTHRFEYLRFPSITRGNIIFGESILIKYVPSVYYD